MKATRRTFLASTAMAAARAQAAARLDGSALARRHSFISTGATPNFFEGMLLGNGDIGLCVTVRPDALGLHIGKEDSWDIRVSEDHYRHVVRFGELLEMWREASEEAKRSGHPEATGLETRGAFGEYTQRVRSSYDKTWPRPWPCGIVWVHWDSRCVRVRRQRLDLASGLLEIDLRHDNLRGVVRDVRLACLVNQATGHIAVSTRGTAAPFVSVAYYPNIDPPARLPHPRIAARASDGFAEFSGYQHFPAIAPTDEVPDPPPSPKDRNFALAARVAGTWTAETDTSRVLLRSRGDQPFRMDIALFTPRDTPDNVGHARREAARLAGVRFEQVQADSAHWWSRFWSRSAVSIADPELERLWYRNQYLLACCLREGKVAPGLFGNWTSGKIGTAWHGDYHMNYNTQQVFWGVFSSNHVDQHLPYVELCENLLSMSERYAREKFDMPGAFFPHSAYPVPSETIPYPVPPWGYEICETPWTVQSLWWHYLYTLDRDYLRRAYPMLRAASRFLAAYVKKGDDGRYHIVPTVSPENWGFTVDFRLNRDCIIDLALAEFVLEAAAEAARILDTDARERDSWARMAREMARYPTVKGPFGEVWTDVADGPAEYVYNVPVTLAPVFPGERVGIGLREDMLELARRSARTVRLEGGNDIVYLPLIRARLGMLDLDWFRQEVRYCQLPNGVVQDRTRQVGGRYRDTTDTDFMMRMGIWTENLSIPAVLNECMLQSYSGAIRLFPNRAGLAPARFQDLRAAGAFLVSAAWDGKVVSNVSLLSEKGTGARVVNPWGVAVRVLRASDGAAVASNTRGGVVEFPTSAGQRYAIERA